ncbi:MAG: tetratricopeptide repeat protein [Chloroflexi bacterium]|nr:tetratricopeptide repeat protein [Chloroflexota bacterium]
MAKVSLRIYNREIESLVDQGHTDEAIAHCHHILKTFPKHLETYRMLGKAHLEAKHYDEAVDIFSRVLMAVPEDFVAHVGMSIVRDEQNKLDDAIWHMERAFESQPSNAAIQSELQRLYGRRDGMEPPKIRMTRGALAYVYVQGELYPQAVAEIRAVLSEDPNRGDMKVLLARAYFRSGQKADASDMCAQLLKQYPYCFDANRIMVELLPATAGAAESTQVYRARVFELDPYATFAKVSMFQSKDVADAAINLERLEYTGNEVPMGQDWGSSLGIGLGSAAVVSSTDQPDWLKASSADSALQSNPTPASASEQHDEIPDFLRAAGWGESNTPEQPTSMFDQEPAADDLVPAELPDWLKGQAPATDEATQPPPAQSIDNTPDWLSGLGDVQTSESTSAATQPNDLKDWLSGLDDAQEVKVASAQPNDVPDWLGGLGEAKSSEPELAPAQPGEVPDWLSGLNEVKPSEPEPAQASDVPDWLGGLGVVGAASDLKSSEPELEPAQPANIPDWLSGLGESKPSEATPAEPGNVPDWLTGLDEAKTAEEPAPAVPGNVPEWLSGLEGSNDSELEPAQPANIPDWLTAPGEPKASEPAPAQSVDVPEWLNNVEAVSTKPEDAPDWLSNMEEQPVQPKASVESLGASAQEQDDAVAWLESLAAKHGAKPEELVTDPSKRSDVAPDWVQQAQNINQQTTAQPSIESLGATNQEQDDAVAWLESLAAKHGAKPEELVTDPSKRSETPPEWVQQAQAAGEAESIANAQKEEAAAPVDQSARVEDALNVGEQFFAEFENTSVITPATDETGMWLRNLDEKEKQQDDFITPSAKEARDVPEWLKDLESEPEPNGEQNLKPAEIPEWLKDAEQPVDSADQFEFTKEEPVAQNSDLPNWLSGIEEESAAKDAVSEHGMTNQDLSDWLSGLDNEPGLPFDSVPRSPKSILSDSMPLSETPVKQESAAPKSDLPDWLSDVDSNQQEDLEEDLWKKSVEQEVAAPASASTEEPAPVSETVALPEWLQGVDEESTQVEESALEGDDTPPWLHREKWEAEGPVQATPTSPSDWHPVEAKETAAEPIPQPVSEQPASVAKKKPGLSARQTQPEAQSITEALNQAKGELDRGDIPTALNHYGKLIKKGKHLEEAIRDLNESLYRYPVEVGIWQTLGDAYMRSNRLKEALEAYNKAEELIR